MPDGSRAYLGLRDDHSVVEDRPEDARGREPLPDGRRLRARLHQLGVAEIGDYVDENVTPRSGRAARDVRGRAQLAAHHSFAAEFDGSKPVTLKGTVTKMEWTNPHAWLHIDVKGPDGKTVTWMIEGGAPNALLRRGWNRTSVAAGTAVVVQGIARGTGRTGRVAVISRCPTERSCSSDPPARAHRATVLTQGKK